MKPSTPGTLADPAVIAARRAALAEPRMAPLCALAAGIRARHGPTPDFDPADGGPAARILLLLETPGPAVGGAGIVSADNPTGTGRNLRRLLAEAAIPRGELVIWNAVPWIIHADGRNRAPRRAEIAAGLAELPALLALLPRLRGAVLSGATAGRAELPTGLAAVRVPHPSPTIMCTSPEIGRRIAAGFAVAKTWLTTEPPM